MKFDRPDLVRDLVGIMQDTDRVAHSWNRARINALFEGFPPFDDEEMAINHIETNVNFLEAPSLAHKARSTWNNAFLKPGNYFTVTLDSGPIRHRSEWSHVITREINRCMKKSLPYTETVRATGAQVIMHGIGPKIWEKTKSWRPEEIGIEDLLLPSATKVNLSNLDHFAVFRRYTPAELFAMTKGKRADPGWSQKMVDKELNRMATEVTKTIEDYQEFMSPEKVVEFFKANSGYLDSDAVPTCNTWKFFHRGEDGEDGEERWYLKMILDDSEYQDEAFLYNPQRPFAGSLSEILHIQFGDGANVAPFLYHTVRSLGFLLYGVCHLQNRLRCAFNDAIFRATHEYFRIHGGDERSRLQKAELVNLGYIPDGLEFVPRDQRWQVDEGLVVAGLSQNRQLMSENASAFVQDVDSASGKELTATEVMARLNNANALVSSLLSMAYTYAKFEYTEIARRFTQKNTSDPDIDSFRLRCQKAGVPTQFLNIERWNVEPERVMGAGNKTLELAQAKSMMEIAPQLDSSAQREVKRDYILAVTDDPDKADRWVPDDQQSVTPVEHDAQLAVGALMNMAPVAVRDGIDHIAYVETFLLSLKSIVQDIGMVGMPSPQQIIGLMGCFRHVQGHMKIIAQDPQERQRVKRYGDFLKPIMNQVKAWSQQLGQQAKQNAQQNGEAGKNTAAIMTAQTKNRIAEQSSALKEKRKDFAFVKEQRRKDAQTQADIQKQLLETQANVQAMDMKTAADLRAKRFSAFNADSE